MTEEDEAFDELAKRQGMWGGGFQAKKAMAADKLQDGKCKYCVDGCIACDARAQPAQEPVANSFEEYCNTLPPLWNTHISRTYAEQFFRAGQAAQPAQEQPVPQREWVGLTDEEREGIAQDYSLTGLGYQSPFKAIEAMLKEKNT